MKEHAVINPVCGKKAPETGRLAVMAATLPDLNALAGAFGFSRQPSRDFFSSRMHTGAVGNRGFCLIGPFIGAPHAVLLLENLIARGVDTVIFIGWCGSLSAQLDIGDTLLATAAFSDEGTSKHYGVSEPNAICETSTDLNRLVADVFDRQGLSYKTGSVWTTDAIYRETPSKISFFREKGAVAVEMELSALVSATAFRSIRLCSVLTVSDDVGTLTWKPGFGDSRFKAARKRMADVMPSLVERILYE